MPTGNARRRQWRLAVLVLAAACGPAAPPPTPTPPPAAPRQAQIAELANVVSARPAQTQAWQTAALGDVLGAGGGVLTGDASRARLDLSDGSILRLSANTEFQLLAFPPSAETPVTRLQVAAGQLWVIVTTLVTGASVEVETPTGLATVRGSLLSVEQASGGGLQITCLEGECRLRNPASNAEVVLQPGQQSGQASLTEIAVAPALRWSGFPWNNTLHTSFAFAPFGISYTTSVSPLERGRDGLGARTLNWLFLELAFSRPGDKSNEFFMRLHHRCTVYDLIND